MLVDIIICCYLAIVGLVMEEDGTDASEAGSDCDGDGGEWLCWVYLI